MALAAPSAAATVARRSAAENVATAAKTVAILSAEPATTAPRRHAPTERRRRRRSDWRALTRSRYAAAAGSTRLMASASSSTAAASGCTERALPRSSAAASAAVRTRSGTKSAPFRAGRTAPCFRNVKKPGCGRAAAAGGSMSDLTCRDQENEGGNREAGLAAAASRAVPCARGDGLEDNWSGETFVRGGMGILTF